MKKLFICAMALAAFVSCSKDDSATVLESSQKSIELTILNGGSTTRAITDASADTNFECASAGDLTVLFMDRAGVVVTNRALSAATETEVGTAGADGLVPTTYSFHKLPEQVQQVAVIALRGNGVPTTLEAAKTLWKTETPDAQVANIVVFGESGQLTENGKCEVDGINYPLFEGSVRVAPAHTRFEVLSFQCTDLGQNTYGYSKIVLDDMKFNTYTQTLGKTLASASDIATANGEGETGQAWSWNWIATPNAVAASELEVNMTVTGKNYTVAIPKKTLSIVGYKDKNQQDITSFEAENIYKLTVPFLEANIDSTEAYICVDVDVTIAKWIVNTMTPVFGTNPAQN